MFDLQKFRKDKNLKQIDLVPIFDVTQGYVSRMENGQESITPAHIDKLRAKFGNIVDEYITDNITFINNKTGINTETVEIPLEIWEVVKMQAKSLEAKDRQIDSLINIINSERKKTPARGEDAACADVS